MRGNWMLRFYSSWRPGRRLVLGRVSARGVLTQTRKRVRRQSILTPSRARQCIIYEYGIYFRPTACSKKTHSADRVGGRRRLRRDETMDAEFGLIVRYE